jgi:hypothetical protein
VAGLPDDEGAMEARKLLEAAPFDPDTINVLKRAFDGAWASIGPTIAPDRMVNTRIGLAHAIVAHAGAGELDCERLKVAALAAAVQKHPPQVYA